MKQALTLSLLVVLGAATPLAHPNAVHEFTKNLPRNVAQTPPPPAAAPPTYDFNAISQKLTSSAQDLINLANTLSSLGKGAGAAPAPAPGVGGAPGAPILPPVPNTPGVPGPSPAGSYDYAALAVQLHKSAEGLRKADPSQLRGLNYTGYANVLDTLAKGFGGDVTALNPFSLISLAASAVSDLGGSVLGGVFDPTRMGLGKLVGNISKPPGGAAMPKGPDGAAPAPGAMPGMA